MSQEPLPTSYDVHLYPVVRVKVENVRAVSHEDAVEKALERVESDLSILISQGRAEYAEEVPYALVDVAGDQQYAQSRWICSGESMAGLLAALADWHKAGASDMAALTWIAEAARRETLAFATSKPIAR